MELIPARAPARNTDSPVEERDLRDRLSTVPLAPTAATDIGHDRAWWARQSLIDGTDWQSIGEAALAVLRQYGFLCLDARQGEGPKAQEAEKAVSEAWNAPSWREAALDYHKSRSVPSHRDDPDLQRLRKLLDDRVTLAAAWAAMHRNRPAPEAMLEALVFSLRRGDGELAQPDTQRRLSALDADQLEAVCLRVQAFQPAIAEPWSAEDADLLISAWRKFHGHR